MKSQRVFLPATPFLDLFRVPDICLHTTTHAHLWARAHVHGLFVIFSSHHCGCTRRLPDCVARAASLSFCVPQAPNKAMGNFFFCQPVPLQASAVLIFSREVCEARSPTTSRGRRRMLVKARRRPSRKRRLPLADAAAAAQVCGGHVRRADKWGRQAAGRIGVIASGLMQAGRSTPTYIISVHKALKNHLEPSMKPSRYVCYVFPEAILCRSQEGPVRECTL
jgi:hypothetical protein